MYDCTIAGGTALAVEVAATAARLGLRTALIEPASAWEISSESVGAQWSPEFLEMITQSEFAAAMSSQTLARRLLPYGRREQERQQRLLREARVDCFAGAAKVVGADGASIAVMAMSAADPSVKQAVVDGPLLMTHLLIVATGSVVAPVRHGVSPHAPHESMNGKSSLPSSLGELLLTKSVPQSMVVLGSNRWAQAVAGIYSRLGSDVLLLGRRLPERQKSTEWQEFRAGIRGLRQRGNYCEVEICNGERVLVQTVVSCQTEVGVTVELDLGKVGIESDECGKLWCDAMGRTWHPQILAMGSVVGFPEELRQPRNIRQLLEEVYLLKESRTENSSSHPAGISRMKSPKWLSASRASLPTN
ncbi:FAD-dependent oxidoreductase [Planctopirus hydrillae]|uniref:FAD/NAD(P)-binding domain-containing protein n=1 Tax=Planctopirus hydrillae TaxID=1841610 RepID=A0A1C3E4R6_9PLAN|nr:hypothetical protein A6X21_00890 [Planctopirus hydrillae]